jgi:hypothetical protein
MTNFFPPNIAIVRIDTPGGHRFPLWIPLFLLWIPLLLLSPLIFLVVLAVCLVGRVNPWRAIATFWAIVCSLPGTHVHVRADGKQVLVRIL